MDIPTGFHFHPLPLVDMDTEGALFLNKVNPNLSNNLRSK